MDKWYSEPQRKGPLIMQGIKKSLKIALTENFPWLDG